MLFYMYINLELLEVVYFIIVMLLEVLNMVFSVYDMKWKVVSKLFWRLLDINER